MADSGGGGSVWGSLFGGIFNLFGNIFGANQQAKAAEHAAQIQADAAKYAADKQDAANVRATAYQEQQAAIDRATAETNRFANYGQWAAREGRLGSLQEIAGFGPRAIPAYVPLNGASGATPVGSGQTPAAAAQGAPSTWSPDYLKATLAATGQDPSTFNYWLGKEAELRARGQQLNQPGYAEMRLRQGDQPSTMPQGATSPTAPASAMVPGSLAAYAQPNVLTPALRMPFYQPGSLRAYAGY